VQVAQFACLPIALALMRNATGDFVDRVARTVLVVHVLAGFVFVGLHRLDIDSGWGGRSDIDYPLSRLTGAAQKVWQAASDCPLRAVIGPEYEAGLIALNSADHPLVISLQSVLRGRFDMTETGALFVTETRDQIPSNATSVATLKLAAHRTGGRAVELYLAAIAGQRRCDGSSERGGQGTHPSL
jgi:hypothetical protein